MSDPRSSLTLADVGSHGTGNFGRCTDLMIDLETLGLQVQVGVPVLSIGWCLWDAHGPFPAEGPFEAGQVFVRDAPGFIDRGTVEWWALNHGAAFATLLKQCAEGIALADALRRVNGLMIRFKPSRVWSHGASFDIPVLEHWYRVLELAVPWTYKQVRDTRTLYDACGVALAANPHDAMLDAINQARLVHACQRHLTPLALPVE